MAGQQLADLSEVLVGLAAAGVPSIGGLEVRAQLVNIRDRGPVPESSTLVRRLTFCGAASSGC
jgi:hypothetical protein